MAHPDMSSYPRSARSHSISSDRPSLTGFGGLLSPPMSISPDPVFIAASAASQIVTNDHDSRSESWFDQHGIEPSGETALVAPAALKLVNRFLDQLLFNFLSVAKYTSLAALRPAVAEVLKPKLAKDAINGADQELHEYLGGGDDEEIMALHNGQEGNGDWDLELIWKRTRLRCMVYSSLGDMEEEDEDFYMERENLETPSGSTGQFTNTSGPLSPAVAIFLTSILEFIGEQVLVVAGQASYQRLKAKLEKEAKDGASTPTDIAERVVVEEFDMERVALDRTLGRLWRGWKKRVRSPTNSISMTRSFSRDSLASQPQTSRAGSIAPEELIEDEDRRPSLATVLAEYEHAAAIPIPTSANDIREIEIPGLAVQSDDEDSDASSDDEEASATRPKSMIFFNHQDPPNPTSTHLQRPSISQQRTRSNSLPPPARKSYTPSKQPIQQEEELPQEAETKQLEGEIQDPNAESDTESDTDTDIDSDADISDDIGESDGEENATAGHHKDVLANAVPSAATAAVGAGAVTGIVAAANRHAPQSGLDSNLETDTDEEFTEEPKIMTSSRISIGDRISPDDVNASLRHTNSRSHSIHSLRVIEVSSKSPTISRTSSVSRASSIHSPPADSQAAKVASSTSHNSGVGGLHVRGKSALTPPPARSSAGGSISEVEEKDFYESDEEQMTAIPAELAAAMQGVDVDLSPPHSHITSTEVNREPKPQPAKFLLAAAPPPRNPQESKVSTNDYQHSQTNGRSAVAHKVSAIETSAPPLTPLRETMEVAQDSHDASRPVAAYNHVRTPSERGVNGRYSPPAPISIITNIQRQIESPKSLRPQNKIITRGSPPRSTPEEYGRKLPDQPRSQRSVHTQSSGSSSSHKIRPTRASEDGGSVSASDKGQSFEQLIRSDQTIQYTLTPENMRSIESPSSLQSTIKNSQERPPTNRSHSSSVGKFAGLRSNPTEASSQSTSTTPRAKPRSNGPQPRDARADRDSIGDFADFIRSTGPANSYEPIPPRSTQTHRGANGTPRNFSASNPRPPTVTSIKRSESSLGRKKLQARDAVTSREDSISDLIDFVRSGPQLEKQGHRIPRTVAPFRTTMDSDQMAGAIGGKAIDATLPDPRNSQASNSVNSSVHSQSALLKNATASKPSSNQNQWDADEEDMMPKRKTRRVRDPYAIDISDEEDEFNEAPTRPKPVQEESLADFLRNVPPPNPTVTPIYQTGPKLPSKDIKKKSSTPSLMSRFGRSGSISGQKSNSISGRSLNSRSGATSSMSGKTNTSVSSNSKPGRPNYTPIAAKFTSTTTAPREANYRSENYSEQVGSARGSNRVPRKAYQPRDAVAMPTARTSDLADFLMSEPPSSMQTQPQTFVPNIHKEETSTFSRMFSRKKVH
ncbi:uncharacterized protein BP5553_03518 [Venustampulla echinocandica]|uniref:Flo11 n=1 Tax=Venustampulla echinocandica TaxID=2656787 RepID=A0A370TUL6_9HELO|nr:uncharacterized protein BP5553_03518 [Venustampulla echinocandica]RDL39178.1 hypothetical protein BP5553_03518 [Venustampulla echinocandica]